MFLTKEQIAIMAPNAAHVRIDGSMYQMDWCDPDNGELAYSDGEWSEEYVSTFEELSKQDVTFYELTEMVP